MSVAQDNKQILLSVQFLEGVEYLDNSSIFTDFEAMYPDVEVNVIYRPFRIEDFIPHEVDNIEDHLDAVDNFTLQADVLMMSIGEGFNKLSLEATRAGYILDLAPLFDASDTSDASVYYPIVWQAAQWEDSLWMLPTSASIYGVVYDSDAFDTAGLSYPDVSWTAENFANAAEVLAVRNTEENVMKPGFFGNNRGEGALVYHFLGQPLYDNSQFPPMPQFLRPDTLAFANLWLPSLASGAMFNFRYDYGENFVPYPVPLTIDRLSTAYLSGLAFAPLPNNGLVNINGFVVSTRTQYPQLAYELASYLAEDIRVADSMRFRLGGMTLARLEYPDVESISNAPYMIDRQTQDARFIMNVALFDGIPASELLFYPYFQNALFQTAANDLDIETALRDAEILAMGNLEIAELRRSEIAGTIPTPVPEIALASHEIELTFYHAEGDTILWDNFAQEFTDTDPEVGRVIMQSPSTSFDFREEGTDCFYAHSRFSQIARDYVIDISPLLAADSDFVAEDWLTGVFDTVREGESIYALPLDIRPLALWYDANQLEAQGLLPPRTNSELLAALSAFYNGDNASLSSFRLDTTLLMLIASQGAIPINYSRNSIQIDFISENNVPAIQQVLDLARDGTLKYGSLTDFTSSLFPENEPFITNFVVDSMFRDNDYLPIIFPAGSEYTPVAYSLMAGYISRFSQHPEACYRLLRSLSHRPDLLNGIPAQRSEANRSEYATFYDDFNQQLNASNLVVVQGNYAGNSHSVTFWLYRAFDHYVLEDANLLSELNIAEQFTNEYLLCVGNGGDSYNCALQVDPTVADDTEN